MLVRFQTNVISFGFCSNKISPDPRLPCSGVVLLIGSADLIPAFLVVSFQDYKFLEQEIKYGILQVSLRNSQLTREYSIYTGNIFSCSCTPCCSHKPGVDPVFGHGVGRGKPRSQFRFARQFNCISGTPACECCGVTARSHWRRKHIYMQTL